MWFNDHTGDHMAICCIQAVHTVVCIQGIRDLDKFWFHTIMWLFLGILLISQGLCLGHMAVSLQSYGCVSFPHGCVCSAPNFSNFGQRVTRVVHTAMSRIHTGLCFFTRAYASSTWVCRPSHGLGNSTRSGHMAVWPCFANFLCLSLLTCLMPLCIPTLNQALVRMFGTLISSVSRFYFQLYN